MTAISAEVWSRLGSEVVRGETLWARRAAPSLCERLIAAVDADDRRHLLIPLREDESELNDTQTRGIHVSTRELSIPGQDGGRYLDITCQDAAGHEAFNLLGGELAERLAHSTETATEAVSRVLSKWRRFWGQLPLQTLSLEEQLGLFAELWFLFVWLTPNVGVSEAFHRWRSPFGSRHDFEWRGVSVEVKATLSVHSRVHWVNGLEQLAEPESGRLLFFSLRLRQEAGASNTLGSLIAAHRALFESDAESLSRFESMLSQAGYSPAHDEVYARNPVRVVDEALFSVRDDFPRITPEHFANGRPNGVEEIRYQINLSSFGHLMAATTPNDPSMPSLVN